MSKTTLYVVIAAILLGGGYYAYNLHKNPATIQQGEETSTATTSDTPTSGKKIAFSEFIKKGGSYKCDVKQAMSDMQNDGTVYIDSGNISGEYTTVAEGMTIKSSFIMKDGYSYSWSSALPTMGFKVKVNTDSAGDTSAGASGNYSWNANQIGDYNCEAWTPDQSKFVIPASVTFKAVN